MPGFKTTEFNPRMIGKSSRHYDEVDSPELKKICQDLEEVEFRAKLIAKQEGKSLDFGVGLVDRTLGLLTDLYYGLRDLLAGKKVKTALTIMAGILVGAAFGAVLGTIILPAIGTGAGAAVGAASGIVATLLPIVGGGIGLSLLGAVGGGFLGNFFSSKVYLDEHRYQLSKRVTTKIRARSDVSSATAELMNGYLRNRQVTVKSGFLKKYYKDMRTKAFRDANPATMETVAWFFCYEMDLLRHEISLKNDPKLQEDLNAVEAILESLSTSNKFSQVTMQKIQQTLEINPEENADLSTFPEAASTTPQPAKKKKNVQFSTSGVQPPAREVLQGMRTEGVQPLNSQLFNRIGEEFQRTLSHKHRIENVQMTQRGHEQNRTMEFKCKINPQEKIKIFFKQEEVTPNSFSSGVFVKKSKLNEGNQTIVSDMLISGVKALQAANQESGHQHILTIDACGDDAIAIQFMTVALKEKLPVQLNDEEYPDTPEMNARRECIIREAHRLANVDSKPGLVGLRVTKRNLGNN